MAYIWECYGNSCKNNRSRKAYATTDKALKSANSHENRSTGHHNTEVSWIDGRIAQYRGKIVR